MKKNKIGLVTERDGMRATRSREDFFSRWHLSQYLN